MQQKNQDRKPNNSWLLWVGAMVLAGSMVICGYALKGVRPPDPDGMNVSHRGLEPDAETRLGATLHNTFISFRSQSRQIVAGQTTIWKINVQDAKKPPPDPTKPIDLKNSVPVESYSMVHQKLMHFLVVSNDLTYFNHIHPDYTGYGSFIIETKLPRGGSYKFYADYTPSPAHGEKDQQEVAQYKLNAEGPIIVPVPLVADGDGAGLIRKTAVALPDSVPLDENVPQSGDQYRVSLRCDPPHLQAHRTAMLHFRIRDSVDKPIADLQPYLGAMAHAMILSASTKVYLHTHPMVNATDSADGSKPTIDPSGEDVVFPINFPKAGLFKFWVQFKRNDQIITAPFVLNIAPAAGAPSAAAPVTSTIVYVCPMHPDITSNDPNATCPRCHMALVKRDSLKK